MDVRLWTADCLAWHVESDGRQYRGSSTVQHPATDLAVCPAVNSCDRLSSPVGNCTRAIPMGSSARARLICRGRRSSLRRPKTVARELERTAKDSFSASGDYGEHSRRRVREGSGWALP